jgi:hypothetical protein
MRFTFAELQFLRFSFHRIAFKNMIALTVHCWRPVTTLHSHTCRHCLLRRHSTHQPPIWAPP